MQLIVRSHEGPDAREKRPDMEAMNKGYTVDHVVNAGKLITLFSAPDYPQFQASEDRYYNKGAYIVLEPPDFSDPHFFQFEAVKPRPKVRVILALYFPQKDFKCERISSFDFYYNTIPKFCALFINISVFAGEPVL